MYDGENLNNLMKGQISKTKWADNFRNFANIGFSRPDQSMICIGDNTTYIYSFTDEHWVESLHIHNTNYAGMTNIVSTIDGASFMTGEQNFFSGEHVVVEVSTVGTIGKAAYGRMYGINGGEIDTSDVPENFEVYGKKSDGSAITYSGSFPANIENQDLVTQLACVKDTINEYGLNNSDGIFASWAYNDTDGTYRMIFTQQRFDDLYNSSVSGNDGLFIGTSNSDTGSWGDFTFASDNEKLSLTGGQDASAGVWRIHIDRGGSVEPGVIYMLFFTFARQMEPGVNNVTPHFYQPTATGEISDIDFNGAFIHDDSQFSDHGFDAIATYTTLYGDDEDDITQALKDVLEANESISSKFIIYRNTSDNYVQLTARSVGGHKGYWWLMGQPVSFSAILQGDGARTLDTGIRVQRPQPIASLYGKPSGIHTWSPLKSSSSADNFKCITRDIFSSSIGQRKKVYKVYVTYNSNGYSKVKIFFIVDGKDSHYSNYKSFTGISNYDDTNGFDSTSFGQGSSDWRRAELKPTDTNDLKNIHSLRLVFVNENTPAQSTFQINDIEVVYRVKNVK